MTDGLNKRGLGRLSEGILTVENILPQQTKFEKLIIVFFLLLLEHTDT